jgi:hypothetical protein
MRGPADAQCERRSAWVGQDRGAVRASNDEGQFVYFGDNKTPGHELHETGRGGNRILRRIFDLLHAEAVRGQFNSRVWPRRVRANRCGTLGSWLYHPTT